MAHKMVIEINLLHPGLCSGCPCKYFVDSNMSCILDYWDERKGTRESVWFNVDLSAMGEDLGKESRPGAYDPKEGWGIHTSRPEECIEAHG